MNTAEKHLKGREADRHRDALLLVDVINDLNFPEANALLRYAVPMARRLHTLKTRARRARVPTIYVNDNFGKWQSNFAAIIAHVVGSKGKEIVRLLRPTPQDYFVLKPVHSGFHCTSLDVLLQHLGTKRLVIGGMAANICVLFTANDAYMRGYELVVPRDCVASNTVRENRYALDQMGTILKADTRASRAIRFARSFSKCS